MQAPSRVRRLHAQRDAARAGAVRACERGSRVPQQEDLRPFRQSLAGACDGGRQPRLVTSLHRVL